MDSLCYYSVFIMLVVNTDIDIKIFRLYKQGLNVSEIQKELNVWKLTQKTIAQSIAVTELTIVFEEGEIDGFFIIPSLINYHFRL